MQQAHDVKVLLPGNSLLSTPEEPLIMRTGQVSPTILLDALGASEMDERCKSILDLLPQDPENSEDNDLVTSRGLRLTSDVLSELECVISMTHSQYLP